MLHVHLNLRSPVLPLQVFNQLSKHAFHGYP